MLKHSLPVLKNALKAVPPEHDLTLGANCYLQQLITGASRPQVIIGH